MGGLAYLFERFPSYTQTFCLREVEGVRRIIGEVPVFSVRHSQDEEIAVHAQGVDYLPQSFATDLENAGYRRAARKWLEVLRETWGSEVEKRRIYEALWLIPRLKKLRIEHLHVHFAGIAARTAFWIKRISGVTYSFTAHANDIFRDEPEERLAQLVAEARLVITVSDFSAHNLRERFPASSSKIVRIYNGIPMASFGSSTYPDHPRRIVSVGRCIPKKGFGDLIEACALLDDRDFVCEIIGSGPLQSELAEKVESLGLNDRVRVMGARSQEEIIAALRAASIFALPCVDLPDGAKDNLPTVIVEAMAAGVPVVSTRVGGIPEMIRDGETGYLVAERHPAELAVRLGELLDDPCRIQSMGAASHELCNRLFAIERTTEELVRAMESVGVRLRDAGEPRQRSRKWWPW